MKIECLSSLEFGANCYIIILDDGLIVVDPCVQSDLIEKKYQKKIRAVLITHGHFDHILKIKSYFNKGISFYMHKNCLSKIRDSNKNLSKSFGFFIEEKIDCEKITLVNDGIIYNLVDNIKMKVLYTPGHSDCSLCFIINNTIFTGDTLFKNGIGRSDLYSSNTYKLNESLKRLMNINDNYIVYPGHGDSSNLSQEIQYNQYLVSLK